MALTAVFFARPTLSQVVSPSSQLRPPTYRLIHSGTPAMDDPKWEKIRRNLETYQPPTRKSFEPMPIQSKGKVDELRKLFIQTQ